MKQTGTVLLELDPVGNQISKKKELRHGLSMVAQAGDTLWLANDETVSIERLSLKENNSGSQFSYGNHKQFLLHELLSLPVPPTAEEMEKGKFAEADLEGVDYKDGYLWVVGSHSLKRKKVDEKATDKDNLKNLAKVSSEGNRFLLARIPLVKEGATYTLVKEAVVNGKKYRAAQLRGNDMGNDLTNALKKDDHLKMFLSIPGKDNGFDIEGLAVAGTKVFVGLRGPVLRGWTVILELTLKEVRRNKKTWLQLEALQKYFLEMDGLGVRDLCMQGDDLLILAGPTMDLDGPVAVYRWKGAVAAPQKSFVFRKELEKVLDVPFGQGEDHAEGMTLFSANGSDKKDALLVVYDAASQLRQSGEYSVLADLFAL